MTAREILDRHAAEFQEATGLQIELGEDGGGRIFIVIQQVPFPPGLFGVDKSDVLFITDRQYPYSALDMFWTDVSVVRANGTIPRRLVVALCGEISAATVGLDWSEHGFTPGGDQKTLANCSRDLMASLDDEQHLTVYDDEARQGVMWALEDWLTSHDIPFTRFAEATIDCGPMRTDFRPSRPVYETFTDAGRDTLIEASALNKVVAKLQERNRTPTRRIGSAIRTLRRLIGTHLPPLPLFEIGPTATRHRVR